MRYKIRLGVPEMEEYWKMLSQKVCDGIANKNERKEYRQIGKAMSLLANNPRHPSLNSHEIKILSIRYKQKVFESYLKNKTPAAGRIFWSYGPNKQDITIIAIESHPDHNKHSYDKITLSALVEVE